MRQNALPRAGGLPWLFAHLPRGPADRAQRRHDTRCAVPHPRPQRRSCKSQHGRDQHQRIGIGRAFRHTAQGKLTAHRMTNQHMMIRIRFGFPVSPEPAKIVDPVGEIADMAGGIVIAQPARSALPAPVDRGDRPAPAEPIFQRLEIFLIRIAAPAQKQQRTARLRGSGPIDPADRVPVGGVPRRFAGVGRNGAAGSGRIGGNRAGNGRVQVGQESGFTLGNGIFAGMVTVW